MSVFISDKDTLNLNLNTNTILQDLQDLYKRTINAACSFIKASIYK